MPTEADYVLLGRTAILELLAQEAAAPWLEIEARAADRKWGDLPYAIDPHILTKSRRGLRDDGILATDVSITRGGSQVPILYRTDLRRSTTRQTRAAARKRLLDARHQSWARSTSRHRQGLIGAGGEAIVHKSLVGAAPLGFRLVRPDGGEVTNLLGGPVPGGPLDSAAFLQVIDPDGFPTLPVVLVIEVKNVRHWLYPSSLEVFQCLAKGGALQAAHPQQRVLPVVIGRRRHYRTFQMARDLGFFVIEYHRQAVLPDSGVDPGHFEEVRDELGYSDLLLSDEPPSGLVKAVRSIPDHALVNAQRWSRLGPALLPHFEVLRDPRLRSEARNDAMNAFRADAAALMEVKPSSLDW